MVTVKGNTYTLNRSTIGDLLMLVKNDKPIMVVPDELQEDFIQLLTYAGAAARLIDSKTDLQTNKTNENEKDS